MKKKAFIQSKVRKVTQPCHLERSRKISATVFPHEILRSTQNDYVEIVTESAGLFLHFQCHYPYFSISNFLVISSLSQRLIRLWRKL